MDAKILFLVGVVGWLVLVAIWLNRIRSRKIFIDLPGGKVEIKIWSDTRSSRGRRLWRAQATRRKAGDLGRSVWFQSPDELIKNEISRHLDSLKVFEEKGGKVTTLFCSGLHPRGKIKGKEVYLSGHKWFERYKTEEVDDDYSIVYASREIEI